MVVYHQAKANSSKKQKKNHTASYQNNMIQRVKKSGTGKVSEIYESITAKTRGGRVPAIVVQSHDFFGFGGHMILFVETPADFSEDIEENQFRYTKIDLDTQDSIPNTFLWSGVAKSSDSTSSNISSSTGSPSSGPGSSTNAGFVSSVNFRIVSGSNKRPLNTENANKIMLTDDSYNTLKQRVESLQRDPKARYKLFPTGTDNKNNKYNCASFVADILEHAGFKITFHDTDWKDLKYVTPSRIRESTIIEKPKQE